MPCLFPTWASGIVEGVMGYLAKICMWALILIGLSTTFCSAGMVSLSESEMEEFVAQEGICDIMLPETCVTDNELAETMDKKNEKMDTNSETITTNPNLAILTGLMSPSNPYILTEGMAKNPYAESVTFTPNQDFLNDPSIFPPLNPGNLK